MIDDTGTISDLSEKRNAPRRMFIYALVEPDTRLIFYVGFTGNPRLRLFKHLSDSKDTPKTRRIAEIRRRNLKPQIEILEELNDMRPHAAIASEVKWILTISNLGFQLENCNKGGAGVFTHTPESIAKIAAASKGRIFPKDTSDTRRKVHLNQIVSDETRKKQSEIKKGRKLSQKHLKAIRSASVWIVDGKLSDDIREAFWMRSMGLSMNPVMRGKANRAIKNIARMMTKKLNSHIS